jgi:hypothetical protein
MEASNVVIQWQTRRAARTTRVAEHLTQAQVAGMVRRLDDVGATLVAVVGDGTGIFTRFTMIYRHTEELEYEVRT